ncbi:MAG: FAD-dependent oxidoreductase [Hyphomicrobiales bacterium]
MPLEDPKPLRAVVVGAGISGIRASLDLAEHGFTVHLLDRSPAIGGILGQLDHQFPNDHCGICRMLPMIARDTCVQGCLRKGLFHENIEVLPSAEVLTVAGPPGQMTVALKRLARGVDPERCTGCGACDAACPVTAPDAFNAGLSPRKAIYQPVPHQDPNTRVIDRAACTRCGACVEACPAGAIRLDAEDEVLEIRDVAGVILAPGAALFDPAALDDYSYGVLPNVVTATAFERMLSSSGPWPGVPVRPSDRRPIRKLAWVQCVGSRNVMLGADHCSSACCMFAVKEAVLFHQKSSPGVQTAIFYMDMRTFGRDFQRYRDRAENEIGVRFVRCRLHSIEPAEQPGDLAVRYVTDSGVPTEEVFDLVVLSTGHKPEELPAAFAGLEGVVTVGSAPRLRDIAEAVLDASAASGKLIRLTRGRGMGHRSPDPLDAADRTEKVFQHAARIQVVFCEFSKAPEPGPDVDRLVQDIGRLPGGVTVSQVPAGPGPALWDEIKALFACGSANRFVLVVSNSSSCWGQVRRLCAEIGLPLSLVELVDLHHLRGCGDLTTAAAQAVEMAVNRLRGRGPRRDPARLVEPTALVLGGGPAGLVAAEALAENGIAVALVERESSLGGNLPRIHDPELRKRIEALIAAVEHHPRITVHRKAELIWHHGLPGNFIARIRRASGEEKILDHGAVILATGGRPAETDAYGLGSHERIVTQFELERRLHLPDVHARPLRQVVMIQCAGSREEPRNYCSRICCLKALTNAIRIKDGWPAAEVYVLYRDIMTYGESEQIYTEARRKGVLFIPFDTVRRPVVRVDNGELVVSAYDPVLGEGVELKPDLLALAVGVVPAPSQVLARMLGVALTDDGFWKEADSKWRPVDSGREGVFLAGLGRAPARADEAMREGEAAALRALHLLAKTALVPQRVAARVRHAICSRCELCIEACPYAARYKDPETGAVMVDHASCQGCGGCAAVCPNSATVMGDFEDNGILDMIEAAL